jgi:hypothetical protein
MTVTMKMMVKGTGVGQQQQQGGLSGLREKV